ncbi:hypothetical protein ANN_03249 [Periplaneta americana]|uniref:Uncharacterized protein n=1 Tax=Periplaneta americana TaxID=6978 RepID=A0ABQ8U071_PERAM|nr:hypothetical protein ANN_03249 [Periplaneta americana]
MATVVWDNDEIILVDWLKPGTTINSTAYVATLWNLCHAIQKKWSGKWVKDEIPVLPHPQYSPDLALLDYHPFGALKKPLRRLHFADWN